MHSLPQFLTEHKINFHVSLHNQFKHPHNTGKENFCSIWSWSFFMYINKYMFSLVHSSVFTYKQNRLNKQWKVLLIAGWTIHVLLFKPTQVWHFVGIYLHTLRLLRVRQADKSQKSASVNQWITASTHACPCNKLPRRLHIRVTHFSLIITHWLYRSSQAQQSPRCLSWQWPKQCLSKALVFLLH